MTDSNPQPQQEGSSTGLLVFSWLFAGIPLAWGVYQTVLRAAALFQ